MSNATSPHTNEGSTRKPAPASKRSASGGSALASTTAACGMVMLVGAAAVLESGEIGFRSPLLATALLGGMLVLLSARLRLTSLARAKAPARPAGTHELAVWKAD